MIRKGRLEKTLVRNGQESYNRKGYGRARKGLIWRKGNGAGGKGIVGKGRLEKTLVGNCQESYNRKGYGRAGKGVMGREGNGKRRE